MVGLDVIGRGTSWGIPGGNKFADYAGHDNTVFSAAFAPSHKGSYVVALQAGLTTKSSCGIRSMALPLEK